MDEKRIEPRWQIHQEAGLTVDGGLKPISCTVEDISTRGMRISMRKNLFPEVFSKFSLALADNFTLNLGAQVVWQNQRENQNIFGLVFNQNEKSIRFKISEYVKNNFPEVMEKQWLGGV